MVNNLDQSIKITNEDEILLLCARTYLNPDIKFELINLLNNDLDWDYLIRRSSEHGLTPLLYSSLNSFQDYVPKDTMVQLKEIYQRNVLNNLFLFGKLISILKLFKSNDIIAIPYKGPILAINAYQNLSLRQFNDLDIFILKKDILKAKELLISNGFVPHLHLNKNQDRLHLKFQREFKFMNSNNEFGIEIQWKFSGMCSAFPLDPSFLSTRENLKAIDINGHQILSFSNEALLLILVIHSAGHLWSRLSWIRDISELITSGEKLDWDLILENANRLGIERILFISLFMARDLFDTKIPKKILLKMYNNKLAKSKSIEIENIIMNSSDSLTFLKTSIIRIRIRENIIYGIKDSISFFMSPTIEEWKIIYLPIQIASIYYILRTVRLVKKYGLNLLSLKG